MWLGFLDYRRSRWIRLSLVDKQREEKGALISIETVEEVVDELQKKQLTQQISGLVYQLALPYIPLLVNTENHTQSTTSSLSVVQSSVHAWLP